MTLDNFISKLKNNPKTIEFQDTMDTIEALYNFSPSAFTNGETRNNSNENIGSCKVFAFALEQQLSKEETLACFGQYYFKDVLENPNGIDHQNIRNFMKTGLEGLSFENEVLIEKESYFN